MFLNKILYIPTDPYWLESLEKQQTIFHVRPYTSVFI